MCFVVGTQCNTIDLFQYEIQIIMFYFISCTLGESFGACNYNSLVDRLVRRCLICQVNMLSEYGICCKQTGATKKKNQHNTYKFLLFLKLKKKKNQMRPNNYFTSVLNKDKNNLNTTRDEGSQGSRSDWLQRIVENLGNPNQIRRVSANNECIYLKSTTTTRKKI